MSLVKLLRYTLNSCCCCAHSWSLKGPWDQGFRKRMSEPFLQEWVCSAPSQAEPSVRVQLPLAKEEIWRPRRRALLGGAGRTWGPEGRSERPGERRA